MKVIYLKKLLYLAFFILIYVLVFAFIMPVIIRSSTDVISGEKYVIITGDFVNSESFGTSVLKGFNEAVKEKGKNKSNFKFETLSVNENLVQNASSSINIETNTITSKFKKDLITIISSKNVIAIVSANTSQTISTCLEVGKTFNIPVLITVATNNQITKGYEDKSFRLLANNGIQANAIIEWMKLYNKNDSSYFGILYSPTIYGNNLLDVIRTKVGFEYVIPFSISTTTDMVGTINYGDDIGISAWVSLSYLKESIEIQVKKEHLDKNSTPILYSDGAYGEWIIELNRKRENNIFLSFPETYPNGINRIKNVDGFGVFGYDAYWLIDYCIENETAFDKSVFASKLNNIEIPHNNNMIQKYKFSEGENTLSKFKIFTINEDLP